MTRFGCPTPKSLDFVYRTGPSKISNSGQPGGGCQPGDKLFIYSNIFWQVTKHILARLHI